MGRVTNEERREVAQFLRNYANESEIKSTCIIAAAVGIKCDGNDIDAVCDECFTNAFTRLADLIEPEQEVVLGNYQPLYEIPADACMNNSGETVLTLYGDHGVPDLIVCDGKQYHQEQPELASAISDLEYLQNVMEKDFTSSENCTDKCPCYPGCLRNNMISCERLIAMYCADELEKILRRLNG